MVVAAVAAAVVLGVVGVGIAAAAGEVVVVVEAAAVEVVIESDFHIGICCGVTGFGYGSGYGSGHAIWAGFHAMAVEEESGVFQV